MAKWHEAELDVEPKWPTDITNLQAKQVIANQLADKLKDGDVVGIGSGSTSYLTLLALAKRARANSVSFVAIPTSLEIEQYCHLLDVQVVSPSSHRPDWSFDGADEIDPKGRLIKGRGGALRREKLVMASSRDAYIVADQSKNVSRLGENYAVPIEVFPEAISVVKYLLTQFGDCETNTRLAGTGKDGPLITEAGCLILDVRFESNVPEEAALESIPGVVGVGVYDRWPYTLIS